MLTGFHWLRSWAAGLSHSPCLIRQHPLSQPYLRVTLAALGLIYAFNGTAAEITHWQAMRSGSYSSLAAGAIAADALFPVSRRIRETLPTMMAQMDHVPPTVALAYIKRAQVHAPHDPRLWFWRGVQHLRASDIHSASEAAARLHLLVPNWPQTNLLHRLIKEATQ